MGNFAKILTFDALTISTIVEIISIPESSRDLTHLKQVRLRPDTPTSLRTCEQQA
jgi:hypothetical protein